MQAKDLVQVQQQQLMEAQERRTGPTDGDSCSDGTAQNESQRSQCHEESDSDQLSHQIGEEDSVPQDQAAASGSAKGRKALSFHEKRSLDAWEKRLGELTEFKEKYGTTLVPLTQEMKQYRSLARWANNKRLQYHKQQLPAHEKKALDAIGFEWKQTRKDIWEEYFKHLFAFKEQYGHTRVWGDYQYKDNEYDLVPLRNWCRTQRMRFRKNSLQADRMAKLDSIGFNWVTNGEAWSRLFQALTVYKRTHGHFNIPQDSYLGRWAARLPLHKKELRKDQLAKLSSIGFDWVPRIPSQQGVSRLQGAKRQSDHQEERKPAAKRQAHHFDQELAMPGRDAPGPAAEPSNATLLRNPESWASLLTESSQALPGGVDRSSIILALQAQQALGQFRQPQHPLPFPPYAVSSELVPQIPPSSLPGLPTWAHFAPSSSYVNTSPDIREAPGLLSSPLLLEDLRRRALLEESRHQFLQQHHQQIQQHDRQRLEHLQVMGQGSPLRAANYLYRQLQVQSPNRFPPVHRQEVAAVNENGLPSAPGRLQELEQLLLLEQQQLSSNSRQADLLQQILGILKGNDGGGIGHG